MLYRRGTEAIHGWKRLRVSAALLGAAILRISGSFVGTSRGRPQRKQGPCRPRNQNSALHHASHSDNARANVLQCALRLR